ncbi:LysM peptidoglycan-binding domain-containing protein [Loktanella agnita]|uniref:LysM peptidoglycan-binding domain-containing protein n=1 Tax=Loktanella agnita TaxID=287097 RepID=UPI0039883637
MKSLQISAAAILVAAATGAQAQEACSTYTVRGGDSLSGIARTAYGSIDYQPIWNANRNVIGGNPNAISVGMRLELPCADGRLASGSAATASVVRPAAPVVSNEPLSIRLVTGSDYAPFTDEGMEGGGVLTQVVQSALDTLDPSVSTNVTFVNDWGSHQDVLLPSGAFDGTFPWVAPDCDSANLSEAFQERCETFLFVDPLYEVVTGVITNVGDPLGTTSDYEAFRGKNICLPEGYSAVLLPPGGLTDEDVNYVSPVDPADCFVELAAGNVDGVELELSQASDILGKLNMEDSVTVNDQISSVSVLTIIVRKDNPQAEEIVATLNQGMANIRNDGSWFSTIQAGFSAYYNN